jgi:predicted outer membrane protein
LTPERFAYAAALGGLKEVHLAQLALNKAQKSEVRQLATTILNDHKQANQELMRLASQKGFSLPPTNIFDQSARSSDRQPVGGRDPGDTTTRDRDTRQDRDQASTITSDGITARDSQSHEQMKQECIQEVHRFEAMSAQAQDFDGDEALNRRAGFRHPS